MLLVSGGAAFLIHASADDAEEKEEVDTRPVVATELLLPIDHQVEISSYGELMPLESTIIAAQVSGEVISWNDNFVAGGVVKRGDILFTIESDTYEAEVLQAEAQVSLAQSSLTEELARQKVAEREARNLDKSQVSDLYLRKPQVLSAQAQLKSAEASLRIAKRNLAKTKVRAPYSALVVSREIGSGQFVSAGTRVAQINNIETAEVIIPIAGFDTPFLLDNMANLSASVSNQSKVPIKRTGLVNRNLGLVDENTRMQHLVIRIDDPYAINNDHDILKFGSYVEVKFMGKELKNVFKIPQSLVNKRKIWLLNDKDELQSHSVEVIREEGDYFFISSGLSERDRLVKNLPEYPQNGMAVKIVNTIDENSSNSANAKTAAM